MIVMNAYCKSLNRSLAFFSTGTLLIDQTPACVLGPTFISQGCGVRIFCGTPALQKQRLRLRAKIRLRLHEVMCDVLIVYFRMTLKKI